MTSSFCAGSEALWWGLGRPTGARAGGGLVAEGEGSTDSRFCEVLLAARCGLVGAAFAAVARSLRVAESAYSQITKEKRMVLRNTYLGPSYFFVSLPDLAGKSIKVDLTMDRKVKLVFIVASSVEPVKWTGNTGRLVDRLN